MFNKVPRGSINHSLLDSIVFFLRSMVANLSDSQKITEFEDLFAANNDRRFCVSFPFARTAIYFALKAKNLPKGSEVIMPPISIKGILDVVVSLGLVPKYVDLDLETFCFDPVLLKEAVNKNTSAVIITYLFGTAPDLDEIIDICRAQNIYIIEDFSQGLNALSNSKKLGSFGDVAIYSSSAIKQIDTFGGGHLISDDEDLVAWLRQEQKKLSPSKRIFLIKKTFINLIYNFATNRIVFNFAVNPLFKALKLLGNDVNKMTGGRKKLPISQLPVEWFRSYTSFQAEVGIRELKLVKSFDQKRISHAKKVMNTGMQMNFGQRKRESSHTYWQLVAYANNAEKLINALGENSVDSCTSSLELLSALPNYPGCKLMPNALKIHTKAIFIPCFARLSKKQKLQIYEAVKKVQDKDL
jgi:perosamine synthetase